MEGLIEKQDGQLDSWHKQVVDYIESNLDKNRYLFHFVRPKGGGSGAYIGIPIALSNLRTSFEKYLWALEEVIVDLEERSNLAVRREIAEKEYQADKMYEITYSTHTREIKLNNLLLAKPDFSTENELFFQYVYENPGRPILRDELENHCGKLKKRVSDILRDLNFTGALRSNFFPVAAEKQVMFVNPITKQYFFEKDLPAINFSQIGRQEDTQGDKKSQEQK